MEFDYYFFLSYFQLDAPLFITWYQCVVTVAICAVLGYLNRHVSAFSKYPSFKIDLKIARDVSLIK